VNVVDPNGARWTVRRRVLPWRRRVHGVEGLGDLADFVPVDDGLFGFIAGLVLIPVVLVFALVIGEVLVLLLLLPVFVLLRVAFGRPWIVDVYRGEQYVRSERVVGWRAAGERVDTIADEIRAGLVK